MDTSLEGLLPAFKQFQLVYVALSLGIPAALQTQPRTASELATVLGLNPGRLLRILRGLVWAQVIETDPEARFRLTEVGQSLLDSSPTSLGANILFQGQFFYSAWGNLLDFVRDGVIPFEKAHGERVFDLLSGDEARAAQFNRPMTARTSEYSARVAELPELHGQQIIVDVGGGEGRLLLDILAVREEARGIIFDLPIVAARANENIHRAGLSDRCEFRSGDMFAALPQGGSVYLLKWVLHDWDDEKSGHILRSIAAAMRPDGTVVIIERIMADCIEQSMELVQADLNMLILNGGAERTHGQFEELLNESGFRLGGVHQIEGNYGFFAITAKRGEK